MVSQRALRFHKPSREDRGVSVYCCLSMVLRTLRAFITVLFFSSETLKICLACFFTLCSWYITLTICLVCFFHCFSWYHFVPFPEWRNSQRRTPREKLRDILNTALIVDGPGHLFRILASLCFSFGVSQILQATGQVPYNRSLAHLGHLDALCIGAARPAPDGECCSALKRSSSPVPGPSILLQA